MSLSRCYIYLISFVGVLSACGGGGGDSGGTTNTIITTSSASVSSAVSQTIIATDNQTFGTNEDTILSSDIKVNFLGVVTVNNDGNLTKVIRTLKGGSIEIMESPDPDQFSIFFKYTPAEDFNGDDEGLVDLLMTNYALIQTYRQTIKLNFHVNPVADERFKFAVRNKKVFVAGDKVKLSLPYQPDAQISVPSNLNFKLSVDNIPVDYSVDADGLTFVMPAKLLAGVNTANIKFDYQGESISLARTITSKIDYGDVEYWLGDKSRPGVTYVVLGDRNVDLQTHLNWVNKEFTALLDNPLIAQYSAYWNLAVIKQQSPESYASVINQSGSSILIGDLKESGETFIKRFVPNYDWVILNTNLDGRATGGYPMVVNLSPINVILHEFGHVHARLADEYADTINSDPIYEEGSSPNVTNFNDYDSIPWKHWILDKTKIPGTNSSTDTKGVGAFLGAFYSARKFYRPMYDSIMRNPDTPFGPVNSEAWVLATYERMGILGSVTNNKNTNVRTFNIARQWDKNLTQIDWFVNDVKQDKWTNQSTIEVDENKLATNSYSVKAELTDLSGYVKNPHAYSAFKKVGHAGVGFDKLKDVMNENFQKVWTFEKSSSSTATTLQKQKVQDDPQTAINSDDWVSHRIVIEHGTHQLTSSSRYAFQDSLSPVTAHSELRAEIVDASGKHLYEVGVDSPYRYYHDATGMVILRDSGSYKIKHPRVNGDYQIIIVDQRTNKAVVSLSPAQQ